MSLTGFPDGNPTRTGTAIGDLSSGMWLSTAIFAALLDRARTGIGQHVATSLLGSLVSLLSVHAQRYLSLSDVPQRTGNAHSVIAPYGVFETADGPLNLAPITNDMWLRLCQLLELPALPHDPRFLTNEKRTEYRKELKAVIDSRLRERSKADWTALFNMAGLPAGPINTLDEVFNDPQVRHCNFVETVEHAFLGTLRQVVTPISSSTPSSQPSSQVTRLAPPDLGEHTVEILCESNFDSELVKALCHSGIVYQASSPFEGTSSKLKAKAT